MKVQSQAKHSSAGLRIDNVSPRTAFFISAFLAATIGSMFVAQRYAPDLIKQNKDIEYTLDDPYCFDWADKQDSRFCVRPFHIQKYPMYTAKVSGVSEPHQLFEVKLKMMRDSREALSAFRGFVVYNTTTYALNKNNEITHALKTSERDSVVIPCHADEKVCEPVSLFLSPPMTEGDYLVQIQLWGADILFKDADFNAYYIDNDFSNFAIGFRFACMGLSVLTAAYFVWSSFRGSGLRWSFEQKWVFALSIFLIIFNNPYYGRNSSVSNFFLRFFTVTFGVAIYGFWLCNFRRIRLENQGKPNQTMTWPKLAFLALIWASSFALSFFSNSVYLKNMKFTFDYSRMNMGFDMRTAYMGLALASLAIKGIAMMWLFVEMGRVLMNFRFMYWRQTILFTMSTFFIMSFFVCLFAGHFSSFDKEGNGFLLMMAIMNIYVYALQFLYAPVKQRLGEDYPAMESDRKTASQRYDVLAEETHTNSELENDSNNASNQPKDINLEFRESQNVHTDPEAMPVNVHDDSL